MMNTNHPDPLERAIDRELKQLPELAAPRALARRVMVEIQSGSPLRQTRKSWDSWSPARRLASLAGLTAVFGALVFGAWQLWEAATAAAQNSNLSVWVSTANALWATVATLFTAGGTILNHLGPSVLIGAAVICALSYAACVGLGTAAMRYAFARR